MIEVRHNGVVFQADGDRLTWEPFGAYDFLVLMTRGPQVIEKIESHEGVLAIFTDREIHGLSGDVRDMDTVRVVLMACREERAV